MVLVWHITDDSPNLPNFPPCQTFPLYSNKIAPEKFSVTDQAAKLTIILTANSLHYMISIFTTNVCWATVNPFFIGEYLDSPSHAYIYEMTKVMYEAIIANHNVHRVHSPILYPLNILLNWYSSQKIISSMLLITGESKEEMEQALSLALKDGEANSSSVTIYVLGQQNAGKSCLIGSLLGDEFEERIATQGADIDVCRIFASSKWSRLKRGEVSKVLQKKYYGKLKVTAQIKISAEQRQPVLKAQNRQQLLESLPELPEAVQADLEQAKTAVLIDDDGINAIIWDFAGQSVYYGLHSMFLKEDNVAMIVFDASQRLQDPVKERDSQKDPYTQKSISPTTTGCESVCYWLQSVHSICRKDGRPLGAASRFVPTVFLVATHIDLIGDSKAVEERKREIINLLYLALKDQPFAKHLAGIEDGLRAALENNCFFCKQ